MAAIPTNLLLLLLIVTLSSIPISRMFQWWSPPSFVILFGGFASLLSLPLLIKVSEWLGFLSCSNKLVNLAMFLCPFMFASSIDLVLSLENDGILSNYMAFYMKDGEPYLMTPYGTAVCYWDGIVHFLLYWAMLYTFAKGNRIFRPVSIYWFGTFFSSMIVLVNGAIAGPFAVHAPILLNVVYIVLPLFYIYWLLSVTTPQKDGNVQFTVSSAASIARWVFAVFMVCATGYSLVRAQIAFGANRELTNYISNEIEKPVLHPHMFNRVAMMAMSFYGVPFTVYALSCLLMDTNTPLLLDLSMLFAGLTANMQVSYVGPYLLLKPEDKLEFSDQTYSFIFWCTNLLMFLVPHLFALYCYNLYPATTTKETQNTDRTIITRSRSKQETRKSK